MERIESPQNRLVKSAASLQQKKHRDAAGLFLAEGVRLAEEAERSGWPLEFCLCREDAADLPRVAVLVEKLEARGCPVYSAAEKIFRRIAETDHAQGLLLCLQKPPCGDERLPQLLRAEKPAVVLDRLQDPGNVGAVLRVADAAGCAGVILLRGSADVYSGKVVRAAMGALFHLPIVADVSETDLLAALREAQTPLLAAALDPSAASCFAADLSGRGAFVFGNEGAGLSPALLAAASQKLFIPMPGQAESLNVATAAAVLLYEALRQRTYAGKACLPQ